MKKTTLFSFATVFVLFMNTTNAQNNSAAESAPNIIDTELETNSNRALWDIHFNYNITAGTGDVGMAGAVYHNNEFWVSRWASDTMYRFTTAGVLISEFVIPGLSGTRALTSDGTYIYASNNTNIVYRINPVTQTLFAPHITVVGMPSVRGCTFDATLNSGAGGFWISNFTTDILSIDMSGNTLSTIPAATHGLTGMYGSAVDNFTAGGPFLWIFDQSGTSTTTLVQLLLPSGTPTGLTRDVFADFSVSNSLTSSLAGGAFISNQIVPGEVTLGGIIQGNPNNVLFGYELAPVPVGNADLGVNEVRTTLGYTQIPVEQLSADSLKIEIQNYSATIVDSVIVDIEVEHSSVVVFSDQIVLLNYPAYGTSTVYSQPFLPTSGLGDYNVTITTTTNLTEPDLTPGNNTALFTFAVTDTIYARDNGIPDGGAGYVVSSSEWAYAVTSFHLFNPDTVLGVWIQLVAPIDGDTTFGVIASMAGGVPTTVLNTGPIQLTSSLQNTYFLPFPGGVPLAAGDYAFGCYEAVITSGGIAQSASLYTPGMNFFYIASSGWTASGIATARFIRPILKNSTSSSMGIDEQTSSTLLVYPNPSTGHFIVENKDASNSTYLIMDLNGKILKSGVLQSTNSIVDITSYPAGIYVLEILSNGETLSINKLIKN